MDRRMDGRVVVKSRMLQHKDQKEGRTSAREEKEESNNVMVPGELLECLLTVKQVPFFIPFPAPRYRSFSLYSKCKIYTPA